MEKEKSVTKDMLVDMFQMQAQMQHKLGYNLGAMYGAERSAYIKEYTLHCNHEMHEMLQEVPYFKHWKTYNDAYDLTKAKEELIDAWHMFMNVALALGFDSETFYAAYMNKYLVNLKRQQDTSTYKPCVSNKPIHPGDKVYCKNPESWLGDELKASEIYTVEDVIFTSAIGIVLQLEGKNGRYLAGSFDKVVK